MVVFVALCFAKLYAHFTRINCVVTVFLSKLLFVEVGKYCLRTMVPRQPADRDVGALRWGEDHGQFVADLSGTGSY